MLTDQERQWIDQHAYVPEHLPDYVAAISSAEPFLRHQYLFFIAKKHMFFNGYPLSADAEPVERVYESVLGEFKPTSVALIASSNWLASEANEAAAVDSYYQLELPLRSIGAANAYMIRRAAKNLRVARGRFGREHRKIVKVFINSRNLTRRQKSLYRRIDNYLKASPTAVLFEARSGKKLAAFNIVDLGAVNYAFYLFSFRSNQLNVPGASDLLFYEMVKFAHSEGKMAVNLGLGINTGIRRFKEKWGGKSFLDYHSMMVDKREMDIGQLAKKL